MSAQPICLITGATDGVGRMTAMALAKHGFRVIVAARNRLKAESLVREVHDTRGATIEVMTADLASLKQVLTHLLGDALQRSRQGRIINLSSSVYAVGRFDPGNLQSEKKFSQLGTYAASKLFMLMFSEELATRLAATRVTANAVHPGVVRTPMMLGAPGAFRLISYLALPFSVSPEKGAQTSLYLATSPEMRAVSGKYFVRAKQVVTKSSSDTAPNRALLWDLSMKALGLAGAPSAIAHASVGA